MSEQNSKPINVRSMNPADYANAKQSLLRAGVMEVLERCSIPGKKASMTPVAPKNPATKGA